MEKEFEVPGIKREDSRAKKQIVYSNHLNAPIERSDFDLQTQTLGHELNRTVVTPGRDPNTQRNEVVSLENGAKPSRFSRIFGCHEDLSRRWIGHSQNVKGTERLETMRS